MTKASPYEDGDVPCPDCDRGLKFLKSKGNEYSSSHKDWSLWGCKNCHKKHKLFNDGDAEEMDWDETDEDWE
jgi:ssDNA-binding Zn-finger/Zn-ribbon topoisomerase 1